MGMWVLVEPVLGHAALGALAIVLFQDRHGVGFDVQRGKAEGAFTGKADEVPVRIWPGRPQRGVDRRAVYRRRSRLFLIE